MKITYHQQYALLLVWHLTRTGKTTLAEAAEQLKVTKADLWVSMKKLHKAKMLSADGSYYSLTGNPTILDVLKVFSPSGIVVAREDRDIYSKGETSQRTLSFLAKSIETALLPILNQTMRFVGNELTIAEINKMEKIPESIQAN